MTRRVLDHDPLTGITTYFDYTSDDQMHITTVQDVNEVLDKAADLRNNEGYSDRGMKRDMWHYARVPDVVALDMLQKHGVNMMTSPVDWKSVLHCINTHYPYLKTTTKHHA